MTFGADLTARMSDWLNPIAVKELRQAVRGKFVSVVVILSLIAQLLAVAVITLNSALNAAPNRGGQGAFTILFAVVFSAGIFFIPMYSGFRMAAERADSNVDLLFITTIRPRTIVFGKVFAVTVLTILLFSAALPFLVFSYVLRGVDFVSILLLLGFAAVLVISQSILALFIGALPTSRPFKILLAVMFFLGTIGVFAPTMALTGQAMRVGVSVMLSTARFWSTFFGFVIGIGVMNAVLLVLTTAIITPPAANRAFPIRLMLTVTWLLSFGASLWAVVSRRSFEVLQVWGVMQLSLITLILLSATSERERWGPRVARTIPENPIRRALAFPFFSGAANGTIWALVMYAATIGLVYTTASMVKTAGAGRTLVLSRHLIDAALAMLAYAMTAVLLRRTILRRVPPSRTWGLVLALFVALTLLPPLVLLTRDAESMAWQTWVHITTMANPFPTAQRPDESRLVRTIFLGIWAGLTTAANAGWIAAQMSAFRRHVPTKLHAISVEESAA